MEAVLAFGRGRWKLSKFSNGEYVGGAYQVPPPHPRTPHAGFDQFSATSAMSHDSLYLGGQKCCS
jgi:hypothetical protein